MSADLVVIGLGHVGLPLALGATRSGMKVKGIDILPEVGRALAAGESPIDDFSDAAVRELLAAGFTVDDNPDVLKGADTVAICVSTPGWNLGPDLRELYAVTEMVADYLSPGQLVVVESPVHPGTTDLELRPILEGNGLIAGRDFNLSVAPEQIKRGQQDVDVRALPKVVAGHTHLCLERVAGFYGRITPDVVRTQGLREAELSKLVETTFGYLKQSIVNELAQVSAQLEIDVWDALAAASVNVPELAGVRPSAGVGGPLLPMDTEFLPGAHPIRKFEFVKLAERINAAMPGYVKQRAQSLLNRNRKPLFGATVLLVGVTYRPDISDTRWSPARALARELFSDGATVRYHDPHVAVWLAEAGHELKCEPDLLAAAADADLVIMLKAHREYDVAAIAEAAPLLLDLTGLASGVGVERL